MNESLQWKLLKEISVSSYEVRKKLSDFRKSGKKFNPVIYLQCVNRMFGLKEAKRIVKYMELL